MIAFFASVLFWRLAPVSFSPSDEGFVMSQSLRLLYGEVPHRDFIWPRPVGSAVLHIVDFAVLLPRVLAGRLVALAEIVLYTTLLAGLVYRRRLPEWSPVHMAGVLVAVVLNIHTFPLMTWHTIDGVLLTALGIKLVTGRSRLRDATLVTGLLVLGCAPLTKQSFFLAPLIGVAVVAWKLWHPATGSENPGRARAIVCAAGIAGIPAWRPWFERHCPSSSRSTWCGTTGRCRGRRPASTSFR